MCVVVGCTGGERNTYCWNIHIHIPAGRCPASLPQRCYHISDETFPGRWVGRGGPTAWPPRSPDLTPLEFFVWGFIKDFYIGEKFEIWLI